MGYFKNRTNAFKNAFDGLSNAMKYETHLKLHFLFLLIVLNCGFYFNINSNEWIAVILCSAMVITLELINSAIESLCDAVMPSQNTTIKYVKDVAAAAVLIGAIASIIIAYLVFWPHILSKWFTH